MNPAATPIIPVAALTIAHVLLVDDDARNLDVLEDILTAPGYRLFRAGNAQEALLALLENDYAAIVLDVRMPSLGGIELARIIKQRKRSQIIPIIFLTAYFDDPKDALEGYEAGAVDYLTKPVEPRILKTKIAIFADLYRKNRELTALNLARENEIIRRQQAEDSLLRANGELEKRVQERTEKLRHFAAIIESSEDAIISKDLSGTITSWNQRAEQLFGYRAEEIIGQSITVLMPPERWNEEPQILERIRRGERIEHYETIRQRKDGSRIEISLTVSPIKDDDGKVVGVSKIVRDITVQKQSERALAAAHQEVLATSRAKDDFLASLSHELRTPLNPVLLLASDAAQNPEFSKDVRTLFATVRNNVELEATLIDDLLDITRISHGKLALNLALVEIHDILKEAVETLAAEFAQKQIVLSLPSALPGASCDGDAVRLKQIFWNVLKNAVKFTPAGGTIKIETSLSEKGDRISIKITDSGIGLTDREISSIFNAFTQGDHATQKDSHRFGGLGLGLAISRMLVELHSGQIHAASEGRNRGATFVIELPLQPAKENPRPASDPTDNILIPQVVTNSPKRILLVEDHEPTRVALTQLLARRKHSVVSAVTLADALQIASHEKIDLVISDIGLPDGDGYALMSELHEKYRLRGIALTGYGTEQDVKRGKAAGFISHLLKPVRMDTLDAALNQFS